MSDQNTAHNSVIVQYVPKFEKVWEMLSPILESQIDKTKAMDALHILLEDQNTAYEGAFILTAFTNWVAYNKIINTDNTMRGALALGMIQSAQFELRLQSESNKTERS